MSNLKRFKKFILFLIAFSLPCFFLQAQSTKTQNVIIICLDGLRWQEIFTGADSAMINSSKYVKDVSLIKDQYWNSSPEIRREKLFPFFWSVIAKKGQLYGNELYGNKVSVENIYKISYPGYNEMLTGYADPLLIPDLPINNRNANVLEYLNSETQFAGKVAAFTSWKIFPYIFNKKKPDFFVNSGYQSLRDENSDSALVIDKVQNNVTKKKATRYDMLTYISAREYIEHQHPRVLFLGFGETDESAHANKYDVYLEQASNIDKMISELWYYVQTDPFYKDNTTFIITTDHGRGNTAKSWHVHNTFVKGSGEIWLALLGPNIAPGGEMKSPQNIYQKQIAATIALILGEDFKSKRKIGKPIELLPINIGMASLPKVYTHKEDGINEDALKDQ